MLLGHKAAALLPVCERGVRLLCNNIIVSSHIRFTLQSSPVTEAAASLILGTRTFAE